jgi:hypothetical protein
MSVRKKLFFTYLYLRHCSKSSWLLEKETVTAASKSVFQSPEINGIQQLRRGTIFCNVRSVFFSSQCIQYSKKEQTGMQEQRPHSLMTYDQLDANQAPPLPVST